MKDQLTQALIAGNADTVTALTQALLAGGARPARSWTRRYCPAWRWSAPGCARGECFIPEVLLSARTMQGALDIFKPHLGEGEGAGLGTVVIGTVEGDLHDIGKNLVAMLLQGAGFTVVNLGTGVTAQQFVAAVKEHAPAIVGMSALLTTTLPHMAETIAALKEAGLRDRSRSWSAGRRSRRPSPTSSAPTATAPTPAWRSTGQRHSWRRRRRHERHIETSLKTL